MQIRPGPRRRIDLRPVAVPAPVFLGRLVKYSGQEVRVSSTRLPRAGGLRVASDGELSCCRAASRPALAGAWDTYREAIARFAVNP